MSQTCTPKGIPVPQTGRRKGSLRTPYVILSEAKDLTLSIAQILRFAQDDKSAEVNTYGDCPSSTRICRRSRV